MSYPEGRAVTDEQKELVMHRLLEAWKRVPSLRLCQLLMNVRTTVPTLFYMEDEQLADAVVGWVRKRNTDPGQSEE